MAHPYKLTEEIKQFVISQKKSNPEMSCRGLVTLIEKNFSLKLSKSLINNVIKQANLSSHIGKRRKKEPVIFKQPIEIQIVRKEREFIPHIKKDAGFIENGGCFFLKAADLKLSLTSHLAENLLVYFSNLSRQSFQGIIEALILMPLFKNRESLWLLIGKEISLDSLYKYSQQLTQIPLPELNKTLIRLGFNYNLNEINELHKQCLLRLNSYVQNNFFPSAYQFLDFPTMRERFYSLWSRIKRNGEFLEIRFLYPQGFPWKNDIVWQEDLSYAAKRVNESRIFTSQREQVWFNPKAEILPASLPPHPTLSP